MAEYVIQDSTLTDIADAIREKTGGSSAMTPAEMVTAIGNISGGGAKTASGFFINTAQSAPPTIEHNLGTKKIALLIFPFSDTTVTFGSGTYGGYLPYYLFYINAYEMFDTEKIWTLDFTTYNTHFSGASQINWENNLDKLREAGSWQSPYQTQSGVFDAINTPFYHKTNFTVTENSIKCNARFAGGKFHWAVAAFE